MALSLIQRALLHLEQHQRIGRRDGFGHMIPSDFLIREIRESLSAEELHDVDIHNPEYAKQYRKEEQRKQEEFEKQSDEPECYHCGDQGYTGGRDVISDPLIACICPKGRELDL